MIEGYIERVQGGRISGWVWSQTYSDASVFVSAHLAKRPLFILRADLYRSDLAAKGKRKGACGFSAVVSTDRLAEASARLRRRDHIEDQTPSTPPLEFFVHAVDGHRVLRAKHWVELRPCQFRSLFAPPEAVPGSWSAQCSPYVGMMRRITPRSITGWCARSDLSREVRRVPLSLYIDGIWVDTAFAKTSLTGPTACKGLTRSRLRMKPLVFRFKTPSWLCDGRPHTLSVCLAEEPGNLVDGPTVVTIHGDGDADGFSVPAIASPASRPIAVMVHEARDAYKVWRSHEQRSVVAAPCHHTVSVLLETVRDTDARALNETIASLRARSVRPQDVVPFGPNAPNGRLTLRSALEKVRSDVVALCGAGDRVARQGLAKLLQAFEQQPDAALVYGDDDIRDLTGRRCEPRFKTRYCPDRVLTDPFFGGLLLMRTGAAQEAFASSPAPLDLCTLAIKVARAAGPQGVRHVPSIVCNRRMDLTRKPPKLSVQRAKFVEALLRAEGHEASVACGHLPRIVWPWPKRTPAVSIIIPTRNRADLFEPLVAEVKRMVTRDAVAAQIILANNDSDEPEALAALNRLACDGVGVVTTPGAFNFSAINNAAARHAVGDILIFMNNDLTGLSEGLFDELVRQVSRPDVGVVGGRLSYPDGTNQHSGIGLGIGGVASHFMKHHASLGRADHGRFRHVQTVSAVTGALLTMERDTFGALGGFETALAVAYNDVDLCLRARHALQLRTIYTPFAHAYHLESATRGLELTAEKQARLAGEKAFMLDRWGATLTRDPWMSPHHSLSSCDLRPATASAHPAEMAVAVASP